MQLNKLSILRFLRIVSPKICVLAEDIAVSLVKIMRIVITVTEPQRPINYAQRHAWRHCGEEMLPARQYLGAFLLQMNQPKQAEKVYREDQQYNPGTGWSLLGLYQSLMAQHKEKEAETYRQQYLVSFSGAAEIPPASAY